MLAVALGMGALTALANLLGGLLAISRPTWSGASASPYLGLAGGFLLAAALLEILPESLEGGPLIPLYAVLGYVVVYMAEQLFATHAHEEPHHGILPPSPPRGVALDHTLAQEFRHPRALISAHAGLAALVGFNVHDFIDGLAIGAALLTGDALGALVFLAVLLHEVPAGFAIAAIMLGGGRSRRAAMGAAFSIAVATLIGVVVPFLFGGIDNAALPAFLALSAGTFIYIAATDLIPAAAGARGRLAFLTVPAGCGLFWVSSQGLELLLA